MKSKVIYDVVDFYQSRKGWVYFLVSEDKRYLKIGKTNNDLNERIKYANYNSPPGAHFSLLLAYNDATLERQFLSLFERYRARYNWHEPSSKAQGLTYDELWKVAIVFSRLKYGSYKKSHVSRAIHKFSRVTRTELCKIPPRKLAPKLKSIIEHELGLKNG
ncbi:GIY-YIG nuclease family protein [Vibrio vulnificus]|nr:GIY-YIG nuclease family protein [Vibrio vulnificus]